MITRNKEYHVKHLVTLNLQLDQYKLNLICAAVFQTFANLQELFRKLYYRAFQAFIGETQSNSKSKKHSYVVFWTTPGS